MAVGCTTDRLGWTEVRADPFSLRVDYPAKLFTGGFQSRGRDDVQWIFGPYPNGTSLMLRAARDIRTRDPYQAACTFACPGETYRLDAKSVGISSGQVGNNIYFSKCVRHGQEMHCLHVIYPAADRSRFAAVVTRMSGTLQ